MMPRSRSSDPDPVWIRIRPDSELLDPVQIRIRPEPKCLDPVWIRIRPDPKCQDPVRIRIRPDLKIVDPVHPYFPVASATSVEAAIKTKMAHFGYSGVRQHGLHVVHKYLFSISLSSIEDKQAFSVAVALYTRICS